MKSQKQVFKSLKLPDYIRADTVGYDALDMLKIFFNIRKSQSHTESPVISRNVLFLNLGSDLSICIKGLRSNLF